MKNRYLLCLALSLLIFGFLSTIASAADPLIMQPGHGNSCNSGYGYDTETKSCHLLVAPLNDDGSCPPGYTKAGTANPACVRNATQGQCSDGWTFNQSTKKCEPPACPAGQIYSTDLEECVDDSGSPGGAGSGSSGVFEIENPLASDDFVTLLNNIITALIKLAVPIAVIMVVWAGFLLTTSGGNEDKVRTARRTILYTVIGFVILLFSKGIVTLIDDIVNGGGGV